MGPSTGWPVGSAAGGHRTTWTGGPCHTDWALTSAPPSPRQPFADGEGEPTVIGLGNRALQIPSVLFLKPDGEFLVGEAAERRGLTEPDRLAREFKRRIGDHVPIMVAGSPFSPRR